MHKMPAVAQINQCAALVGGVNKASPSQHIGAVFYFKKSLVIIIFTSAIHWNFELSSDKKQDGHLGTGRLLSSAKSFFQRSVKT